MEGVDLLRRFLVCWSVSCGVERQSTVSDACDALCHAVTFDTDFLRSCCYRLIVQEGLVYKQPGRYLSAQKTACNYLPSA